MMMTTGIHNTIEESSLKNHPNVNKIENDQMKIDALLMELKTASTPLRSPLTNDHLWKQYKILKSLAMRIEAAQEEQIEDMNGKLTSSQSSANNINKITENDMTQEEITRSQLLNSFQEWLKTGYSKDDISSNHLNYQFHTKIKLTKSAINPNEGNCVLAIENIEKNEGLAVIKKPFILSPVSEFVSERLKTIIENDSILSTNPSLSLAIVLLHEVSKEENSRLKPYLDILPKEMRIPLYFNEKEMKLLKGTSVFRESMTSYRAPLGLYMYVYSLFKKENMEGFLPHQFTLKKFLWAMGIVMTRQNPMPLPKGKKGMALIPLLDGFNHDKNSSGDSVNSFFDNEGSDCIILSPRTFAANQQIYLDYGRRSNQNFFVYSGFVTNHIYNDEISLFPIFRKNDPLYKQKETLIKYLGMDLNRGFKMNILNLTNNETPNIYLLIHILLIKDKSKLMEVKPSTYFKDLSPEDQRNALNWLLIHLKVLLASHDKSIQQQDQAQDESMKHFSMIVEYKKKESEALTWIIEKIESLMSNL